MNPDTKTLCELQRKQKQLMKEYKQEMHRVLMQSLSVVQNPQYKEDAQLYLFLEILETHKEALNEENPFIASRTITFGRRTRGPSHG